MGAGWLHATYVRKKSADLGWGQVWAGEDRMLLQGERAVLLLAETEGSRRLKAEAEGDRRLQIKTKKAQWLQTAEYDTPPGGEIWF